MCRLRVCAVAAAWAFCTAAGIGASADAAAPRQEVLTDQSVWRYHVAYLWPPGEPVSESAGRWVAVGEGVSSPLPPADWTKADFDDYGWPRTQMPLMAGRARYGHRRPRVPATVISVRGRFVVSSPASIQEMVLDVVYWGRPRFYLNGVPVEAGGLRPLRSPQSPPSAGRGAAPQPLREARIPIRPQTLRKGVNVLAIELRQEPTTVNEPRTNIGLRQVRLTAAAGPGALGDPTAPADVQAWPADPTARAGTAILAEPREPLVVRMRSPINGFASGQVVLTARRDIKNVSARLSDLRSAQGAVIPASAVRIRYARIDQPFMPLLEEPCSEPGAQRPPFAPKRRGEATRPDGPRFLPVWLTVSVPASARAGRYNGTLELTCLGRSLSVRLELTVYGWKIGRPRQWRTAVNLLQSPEAVARQYGVGLWSDRHFQLLEKSFALMAQAGNDVLGVNAVGRTVFGDDPLVLFREEAGRLVPQLKYLKRYLSLYDKHCGEPQFLSLQVWHYGMSKRGFGRDGGSVEWTADTIPLVGVWDGKLEPFEYPMYGRPGTERLWKQVMDGVFACVERLGWRRECVILGTSGDNWPNPEIVAFFKKVAPGVRWRAITHGVGCPRWGRTPRERTQPNGMEVAYLEMARRLASGRARVPGCIISCNARDECGTNPFAYWSLPVCNVFPANMDGYAWKGLDCWTYTTPEGRRRSPLNTYVQFGNMVGGTPRTLAMPGPDGAVATVQFECLREGTQDTEAMLFLRDALTDPRRRAKIGDDLAERCWQAIGEMCAHMEIGLRMGPQGGGDVFRLSCRVHDLAAEVTEAVGRR